MNRFLAKFKGREAFSCTNVHMWHQKGCEIAIENPEEDLTCSHVQDGGWIDDALSVDTEDFIQWIEENYPDAVCLGKHSQWDCIYSVVYVRDTDVILIQRAPNDSSEIRSRAYKDKVSIDIISLRPELQVSEESKQFVSRFLTLDEKIQKNVDSTSSEVLFLNPVQGGYALASAGKFHSDFEPDNYSPEVAELFQSTLANIASEEPNGRLTILTGPPGTGKTHFIRSLIQASSSDDAVYITLDSNSLLSISETTSGLFNLFFTWRKQNAPNKRLVFFVDDADEILGRRDGHNNLAVSRMLQLCDGVIADRLNTRIICSTNISKMALDEAIMRPGRLHRHVKFGYLSQEQAKQVFARILGANEDDPRLEEFEWVDCGQPSIGLGSRSSDRGGMSADNGMSLAEVYSQAKKLLPERKAVRTELFSFDKFHTRRSMYQKRHETKQVYLEDPKLGDCVNKNPPEHT